MFKSQSAGIVKIRYKVRISFSKIHTEIYLVLRTETVVILVRGFLTTLYTTIPTRTRKVREAMTRMARTKFSTSSGTVSNSSDVFFMLILERIPLAAQITTRYWVRMYLSGDNITPPPALLGSFIILSPDVVVQEEILKDKPSAVDYDQERETG